MLQFVRHFPSDAPRYEACCPGARLRFRTDATELRVELYYGPTSAGMRRNSVGVLLIDGNDTGHQFARPGETCGIVPFDLPTPQDGCFHNFELVMPYGDTAAIVDLTANPRATFDQPTPRPEVTLAAYGDSVTHGFDASHIGNTFPYLIAESRGWQSINLGIAGRAATPHDGAVIGSQQADLATVLIGVNDWQSGVVVSDFALKMNRFFDQLDQTQPDLHIFLITPLWVCDSWKPDRCRAPLESYRDALRSLADSRHEQRVTLIEGPSLIDPEPGLFGEAAVHPNDQGFAQIAERLSDRIEWPCPSKAQSSDLNAAVRAVQISTHTPDEPASLTQITGEVR